MERIGILGGTFDPVHSGHLQLAAYSIAQCGLSRVVFVPAYHPPHKSVTALTPFDHRVEMLRLATNKEPQVEVSTIERDLPVPTFTIDTLRTLRKSCYPDNSLFFIIGIDAFLEIELWKDFGTLLKEVNVIVSSRSGYDMEELQHLLAALGYSPSGNHVWCRAEHRAISVIDCEIDDISSSQIRREMHSKDLREFLHFSVLDYIEKHGLYT